MEDRSWDDYYFFDDIPSDDNPILTQQQAPIEEEYQFVDRSLRKYRKPPVYFSIALKCIDGDSQKTTCYPGSTIEGIVKIKVDTALAAHHLKLVFKGAEVIYDHSMGKLTNMNSHTRKKKGDQFFAVRTTLWGIHNHQQEDNEDNKWPVLEPGDHQFPFMCEIPMVNYPPTFRHHLAACEFEMMASLERPGIRPFQTIPFSIRYEPYILSTLHSKYPDIYQQQKVMESHTLRLCLLKGREYNILDTDTMPIQLHIQGDHSTINQFQIYLKRKVRIEYGSYQQSDSMVMSYMEQNKFKRSSNNNNGSSVYNIALPIPIEKAKKQDEILSKNFSVLGMTVTDTLSRYVQIEYQLQVSARIKQNIIWSKSKLLFSIPLHFGTIIAPQLPHNLLHYRDPEVVNDTTLLTKPKFIKVPRQQYQEQLPLYTEDVPPPMYINNL